MHAKLLFYGILGWFFGCLIVAIAAINIFWGNDQGFGLFILFLSLLYFPPASNHISKIVKFSIPPVVKIMLGAFILWACLGVGELFNKVGMMVNFFTQ